MVALASLLLIALPATAGASAVKDRSGNLVPVGTVLTGATTGTMITGIPIPESGGEYRCAAGTLPFEGTLVVNAEGRFIIRPGAPKPSGCTTKAGGKPVPIKEFSFPNIESRTSGSGTLLVTFTVANNWGFECRYEGYALPFTYQLGSSQFTFSGPLKTSAPPLCGKEARITGTFTLAAKSSPVFLF